MSTLLKLAILASGGLITAHQAWGTEHLLGLWSGTAASATERTEVVIELDQDGATLSLPEVGVLDWPALSSTVSGDQVQLVFQSDSGRQRMMLVFTDGKLQGTWSDPRFADDAVLSMARAGEPPTLPERRVLITGAAGQIGASLIVPDGKGPFPGVVFLHGSGPQPRDANRFHAQALAQRGIACLIYDKRGVGESRGTVQPLAFADLASDAIAVAGYFLEQPGISHVGFYGHSQGGWIAPLAASRWPATAFVVTSSGPLVSPARESQWEVVRAMRQTGASEGEVEHARAVIEQWYEAMKTNAWGNFERAMETARSEPWFSASGLHHLSAPAEADAVAAILLDHDYDPLPALRAVRAPVLWILSEDDESIDAIETLSLLEQEVSAGRNIRIRRYAGYDHSLRQLGSDGTTFRWPRLPDDLFDVQAEFVWQASGLTGAQHR